MPITVNWNSRSKVFIESRFQDPWSLEEFIEARKEWYRLIKSVDYRVPVLLDLRESSRPPKGVLRHFGALNRTPHPRQGHVYIMGLNAEYRKLCLCFENGGTDPDKSARLVDSVDSIISPE